MAHVLLPCDLPNWNDVQRYLSQLKTCTTPESLIEGMSKIYDICSISLEPEDLHQTKKPDSLPKFQQFQKFLEESLSTDDRSRFFQEILQNIISQALCLKETKPTNGFLYSLKKEDMKYELDRSFTKSLLSNAFFSTFPKRTSKTHPYLQNFNFCDIFQHLTRRSHQKKLKAFLRFFEKSDDLKKKPISVMRKVLVGELQPSLPGWLCSDRPLVPLVVRHEGNIHDAEPNAYRAFSCCSLIGGDVLQGATSQESSLFFAFPELLTCLCFVEELEDNEALSVHSIIPYGIKKCRQGMSQEVNICLMDSKGDFTIESELQFQDRTLLRELNKALTAFSAQVIAEHRDDFEGLEMRRQTPVGESSSSEPHSAPSSRRTSCTPKEGNLTQRRFSDCDVKSKKSGQKEELTKLQEKKKKKSYLPPIAAVSSSEISEGGSKKCSKDGENSSLKASEFPPIPVPISPSAKSSKHSSLRESASSSRSSTRSMKTASESSLELPPILPLPKRVDEEFYTADEESDQDGLDVSTKKANSEKPPCNGANLTSLLQSTSGLVEIATEKPRQVINIQKHELLNKKDSGSSDLSYSEISRRSESLGFVLGGTASDGDIDDIALEEALDYDDGSFLQSQQHERLDDFRKRIRRRTRRHLSRKMRSSSRSSYSLSSSTSSDMEDISEEDDFDMPPVFQPPFHIMRTSSSEPSLLTLNDDAVNTALGLGGLFPPFSPSADTVVVSLGGRKVLVTSSSGKLKAYSYDGVNPNLPVPFKAKFRNRRKRNTVEGNSSKTDETWSSKELNPKKGEWSSRELDEGYIRLNHNNESFSDDEQQQQKSTSSCLTSSLNSSQKCLLKENSNQHKERDECMRLEVINKRSPAAVGPSRYGDPQLRALILWLAASMAELPCLIFYTGHEPLLYELGTVQRKVLARQWTIGDLSCELLRFCRNRLSVRRKSCASLIFEQLLGTETKPITSTHRSYSQLSLD